MSPTSTISQQCDHIRSHVGFKSPCGGIARAPLMCLQTFCSPFAKARGKSFVKYMDASDNVALALLVVEGEDGTPAHADMRKQM